MIDTRSLLVLLSGMGAVGALSFLRASSSKSLAESADAPLDMDYNAFARKMLSDFQYKSFKTATGSLYAVGNKQVTALRIGGSTVRQGAASDPTKRRQSLITYFVKPTDAKRLGQHLLEQQEKDNLLLLTSGAIFPLTKTPGGKLTAEARDYRNPIMYTTYPLVGCVPIELWEEGEVEGKPTYKSWHAGATITEVTRG